MEDKERKLLAAIILACCLCVLAVIGLTLTERFKTRRQNVAETSGQTMMVLSNGMLRFKNQDCAYSIIVDTDTARRYLVIEDADNQVHITNLEQPVVDS